MLRSLWFRRLHRWVFTPPTKSIRRRETLRTRLRLEPLEDRTVPSATYTVNALGDAGNGSGTSNSLIFNGGTLQTTASLTMGAPRTLTFLGNGGKLPGADFFGSPQASPVYREPSHVVSGWRNVAPALAVLEANMQVVHSLGRPVLAARGAIEASQDGRK